MESNHAMNCYWQRKLFQLSATEVWAAGRTQWIAGNRSVTPSQALVTSDSKRSSSSMPCWTVLSTDSFPAASAITKLQTDRQAVICNAIFMSCHKFTTNTPCWVLARCRHLPGESNSARTVNDFQNKFQLTCKWVTSFIYATVSINITNSHNLLTW